MDRVRVLIWVTVAAALLVVGCQGATPLASTTSRPSLGITIPVLPSATPKPLVSLPGQDKGPSTSDEVPRITVQELKSLLDSGRDVAIADTRDPEFYESEHILGAISMPYSAVDQRYKELPRGKTIVFYCT